MAPFARLDPNSVLHRMQACILGWFSQLLLGQSGAKVALAMAGKLEGILLASLL